jgi:hypothetical protein
MLTSLLLSLANAPWGWVTTYSAIDSASDIAQVASYPENHQRPLKEKIHYILKKCIHPLASLGIYLWASSAPKDYAGVLKNTVATASQANIEDPRKLVVLVEGGTVPSLESVPTSLGVNILGYMSRYVPKWKEQFDFVRARVTSVKMLDEVLKKITHVKDRVKPISLLMMMAHGQPENVELNTCEDIRKRQSIRNCLDTYLYKENLDQVDWKQVLDKEGKILMVSCHTGSGFGYPPIAQSLAKATSVPVIAPTWQISPDTMHLDIDRDIKSISIKWLDSSFTLPGFEVLTKIFESEGDRVYYNFTDTKESSVYLADHTEVSPHPGEFITQSDLQGYIDGIHKQEIPQYLTYYVLASLAIGVSGFLLKETSQLLSRISGKRLPRAFHYMEQAGNAMTTLANCALGKAPSTLYNGMKNICQSITKKKSYKEQEASTHHSESLIKKTKSVYRELGSQKRHLASSPMNRRKKIFNTLRRIPKGIKTCVT